MGRLLQFLAVLFLPLLPLRAAIRDGGIDPANLGKGDWIYILPNATNHMGGPVASVTDVRSMMIFLKNQGLRYIVIKAATGPSLYPSNGNPQFTADVVSAGHAAGLWVFGYNRSDGTDIPAEIGIADYVFNLGADGFVFDAESEWESQNLPDNANKAIQLCSAVRTNWPNKFLAHAPFPIITYHSTFPYKEFGYYCDAVMPQDYWIEIGVTPTYMVSWMNSQWTTWQNGLSGQWRNAIKPIVAAGQGWSSTSGTVTAGQVTEFFNALKTQASPATTGGFKGANFWRAELHPLDVWDAIRTNNIGVFTGAPVIGNIAANGVTATAATINWTTDQSSDSVVEYGLDTSYGTSVTNSTPIYYHTITLSGLSPYTTYYFRVKSKSASNQTSVSSVNVFATAAVTADDVIVESRSGGLNYSAYLEQGVYPNGWSDSTAKSTAAGCTGGIGSRYNSSTGVGGSAAWFQVSPTLPVAGGRYLVYVTVGATSAGSAVTSTITGSGWTGLPATTDAFNNSSINTWRLVGTMTNNPGVSTVSVRFDETANNNRFYADAVKFVYLPTTNAPAIVTQPVQSQTNLQGSAATFSVVASGTPPLHYQWRFNGSDIRDAILSSLTRDPVQLTNAGSYTVVITNGAGAVTSDVARLTVVLPPNITAQPTNTTVPFGSDAVFRVSAAGTAPLSYQWQFEGADLSGATRSSLTVTNASPLDEGGYAVRVASPYGEILSSVASLTVTSVPRPHIDSLAQGPDGRFTLQVSGGPGQFAIECAPQLTGWTQLSSLTATGAIFQYTDPETNRASRFYRVRLLP